MDFSAINSALQLPALSNTPPLPFPHLTSGKVREIFDLGDELLIVATDRLSAFDVILPDPIPGKGILLNQISLWWFAKSASVLPNHLVDNHEARLREVLKDHPQLVLRSMLVKKLRPVKLEAVVRGYLAGSGWKEYRASGKICEHTLPAGLQESEKLPQALFTPTTKADVGDKDLPVSAEQAAQIIGKDGFLAVRDASFALYALGQRYAEQAGLILADTKFEFGTDTSGKLYLIDEVLTPDSSRYWPREGYAPGRPQPAFDKQYVRDYLETLDWDKTPPGPHLPQTVLNKTREKYLAALQALVRPE